MSFLQNGHRYGLRDLTNRPLQGKERTTSSTTGTTNTSSTVSVTQQSNCSLPALIPRPESETKYDIDLPDRHDPLAVSDYVQEIYLYLRDLETRMHPPQGYLEKQKEITPQMRTIVIDWICDVHERFRLQHETFFLAVNYFDRFLARKQVAKNKLQLVALGALFVAAKVEEAFAPYIRDMIQLTQCPFTHDQFIKLENVMLKTLDYEMFAPSSFTFLRRYTKVSQSDRLHKYTAHYLIEMALLEPDFLHYAPSHVSAAAMLASFNIHAVRSWPESLSRYSGYQQHEVASLAEQMVQSVQKISKMRVKAVTRKYGSDAYHRVAQTVAQKLGISV
ncbi:hypothetical protein P9112_012377 [Eukaryota sp. TZLM1-RC]